MSMVHAARMAGPSGGISTSTLALVGLGGFVLANPEKAILLLQKALLAISDGNGSGSPTTASHAAQHPIVIHTGGPSAGGGGGGKGLTYALVQVSLGAGVCWGSYVLLVNVLPETAKNMLPVTQGTFKQAVTSLAKGLLHVKDTLSAELAGLLHAQTDLAHKQDETHDQVLYVQDQVADVHDDVGHLRTAVDDCQAALSSTDKRTTYIAKGIRLVTAGMTAMLPPDDELAKELRSFTKTTDGGAWSSAPRHRSEDKVRRSANSNNNNSDGHSRSSSRRSRRSSLERRRAAADTTPRNKPTSSSYEAECDMLSVSTGTPIRHVTIPAAANNKNKTNKTASDEDVSITSTPPELKELEEVRALLVSMDKSRLAF